MAYEPTNWKSGDVVTSTKLNKIEQGIVSNGMLLIHDEDGILDKTWQEIHDGGHAIVIFESNGYIDRLNVYSIWEDNETYGISIYDPGFPTTINYECTSANGYPQRTVSEFPPGSGGEEPILY